MSLTQNLRSYLLEEEFEIKIFRDKIDIINYQEIGHFDTKKIVVKYDSGVLEIRGNHLALAKLMQREILIKGNIEGLEFQKK